MGRKLTTEETTFVARMNKERDDRAAVQEAVNECRHRMTPGALKAAVLEHCDKTHAKYPQYRGHWNDWALVKVNVRVKTKMGVAFEAGDISLGRWEAPIVWGTMGRWVVFSIRNDIDTSLGYGMKSAVAI